MILAVAIFAVGIPFSAIASTKETVNFAILSDTHYFAESAMGETAEDRQEFIDMMLLNNSTTGYAPELLDTALANLALQAKNGEIEFVLMPGDLTRNAEYAAHKEQAEKLAAFEEETGIPVYVINGNHDINNKRSMYYDGENLVVSSKTLLFVTRLTHLLKNLKHFIKTSASQQKVTDIILVTRKRLTIQRAHFHM